MKNLLSTLLLFIAIKSSSFAQKATLTKLVSYQENPLSETLVTSNEPIAIGPIITKDIPVTNPNPVASLYPNPVEGQATIELDREYKEVYVSIADISGNIVQEASFSDVALIQFEVDLPRGVYTINAIDENNINLMGNLFIKKDKD